jgi:Transposase IS4
VFSVYTRYYRTKNKRSICSCPSKEENWQKYVKGELIKEHFESLQVGDVDTWSGIPDNIICHIYGMKESEYIMMMMTIYGTLERVPKKPERATTADGAQSRILFNYTEAIGSHFNYRHMVDDHNAKQHAPISLEDSWATNTWDNIVFVFLVAITEVNMMLSGKVLVPASSHRYRFSALLYEAV